MLEASLLWESVEQLFFWQLLAAHSEVDATLLLPLLDRLEAARHAEAVLSLFQMLKASEPTFDVVKFICRFKYLYVKVRAVPRFFFYPERYILK